MNFTGEVFTGYSPYTPEQPIDAMLMVGMGHQQQLEQGIQKVQGYEDYLHGLDIAKGVTRDYLEGKVSNLRDAVSNVAGDFSDDRLVNQFGGLVGKIASDPVVENGIVSTAAYRKGLQDIEDSKKLDKDGKGGTYAVENEYDFTDKAQKWLGDNDYTTSFTGSYKPKVDYMKRLEDGLSKMHASGDTREILDTIRDNPNDPKSALIQVLNEHKYEGVDAGRVMSLWNQISSDPAVQEQLAIEGRYHFRGYSPSDMYNMMTENYQDSMNGINDKIKSIQQRAIYDKSLKASDVSAQIKALRDHGTEIANQYKSLAGLIPGTPGTGMKDLDASKAALYSTNVAANIAQTYPWSIESDKMIGSPLFQAHMEQMKYELEVLKEDNLQKYRKSELGIREMEAEGRLLGDVSKFEASAAKAGTGNLKGLSTTSRVTSADQASVERTSGTYYDNIKAKEAQTHEAMWEAIFNMGNIPGSGPNPVVYDGAGYSYNSDYPGGIPAAKAAGAQLWYGARQAQQNGNITNVAAQSLTPVDPLLRDLSGLKAKAKAIEGKYTPIIGDVVKQLGGNVDPRMVDQWIVDNKAPGWQQSKARLTKDPTYKDFQTSVYGYQGADESSAVTRQFFGADALGPQALQMRHVSNMLSSNPNILPVLQNREKDFVSAQSSFKPILTEIHTPKEEDQKAMRSSFMEIARGYIPSDTKRGAANDFMSYLGSEGKGAEEALKGNTYHVLSDPNTNKWYLRIDRGGKGQDFRQLEVSEADIQSLGFKTQDAFWNQFGSELGATNNTTTDITGEGARTAHTMSSLPDAKYTVKYHLVSDGKSGRYNMVIWAFDKDGHEYLPRTYFPLDATGDDILKGLQQGIPDVQIEGLKNKLK